jgi:RNA recognition motif-containing protein
MRGPNVIYVGNLPNDIKERELQELFEKVSSLCMAQQHTLLISPAIIKCRMSQSRSRWCTLHGALLNGITSL